jgi:hypothetical protein
MMATLFRLKKPGDKRAHTCDARCYNAKGTVCKCFCGGTNHGEGLDFAIGNCKANMQKFMSMGCQIGKGLAAAIKQAVAEITGGV